MIWSLVLLFVLALAGPAVASEYSNGDQVDGYTWNNGYFWIDDFAYTRSQEKYKSYYTRNGCRYYNWKTKWKYEFHHKRPAAVVADKEPDRSVAGTEKWRSELIALAAEKHKWDYQIRESAQEQKEFLESVDALGLKGYAQVQQAYATLNAGNGQYAYNSQLKITQGPLAQQGNTLYGFNAFAPKYSDVDLSLLFTQAKDLASNSQSLAGQATSDFSALVNQQSQVHGEIDRINARGQQTQKLLLQIANMLNDPPIEIEAENTAVPVVPEKAPAPTNDDGTAVPLSQAELEQLRGVIENKCVSCHNGTETKGGYDMTKYFSYGSKEKGAVLKSLQGQGPSKKVMPLEGEALATEELMLFARDYLTN